MNQKLALYQTREELKEWFPFCDIRMYAEKGSRFYGRYKLVLLQCPVYPVTWDTKYLKFVDQSIIQHNTQKIERNCTEEAVELIRHIRTFMQKQNSFFKENGISLRIERLIWVKDSCKVDVDDWEKSLALSILRHG